MKLNKIYTKTGDDGTTGLVGGSRVVKYALRVETYGTVDEANAAIGLVRVHTQGAHDAMLGRIQHDLFDLGADLATPSFTSPPPCRAVAPPETENSDPMLGAKAEAGEKEGGEALRILETQVLRLEQEIDAMNEALQPLTSFVLPGGSPASAALHVARTVVRRAERLACHLSQEEPMNPHAVHYLNRLSDHLFVMARALNANGANDVLWQPGVNR